MKRKASLILFVVLAGLLLAVSASAEGAVAKAAKKLSIKPASATVSPVGSNRTVTLTISSATAEWEILSGADYVTITPSGKTCLVTAKASGRAVIRGTNPATGNFVKVPVKVAVTPVKKLKGLPAALKVDQRLESYQFTVSTVPSSATWQDITWSVAADPAGTQPTSLAKIDQTGKLTFQGSLPDGTKVFVIAASHSGDGQTARKAKCAVTFQNLYASKIKLSKPSAILAARHNGYDSVQLKAVLTPAASSLYDHEITWTSSNPSVCSVDQDGLVSADGGTDGVSIITASVNGAGGKLKASCRVTVKAVRVNTFKLVTTDSLAISPGESSKLETSVAPSSATYQDVTWSSADSSIASVDSSGTVTGKKRGRTVVTGSVDGGRKTVTCNIIVRDPSALKKVTVSFGGDVVLGGDTRKGTTSTQARFESTFTKGGKPDYDYTFKLLKPVFEKDDLTLVNLECGITTNNNSSRKRTSDSKTYEFVGKPSYLNILNSASVEMVSMVNNHSNDLGSFHNTKVNLKSYGIKFVGNGADFGIFSANGVTIGVCGYQTPATTAQIAKRVKACKAKCDVCIMFFHFCDVKEHEHKIQSSQVRQAHAAVNAGADLVIGCHPHVLSGVELYKGVNIFYDLGSLVSPGKNFFKHTMIAQIDFLVDTQADYVETTTPRVYPVVTCKQTLAGVAGDNDCQPVLLDKSNPEHAASYNKVKSIITQYSGSPKITRAAPLEWP